MAHQTDEEIAVQVQRGNVEAFGELVMRYEEKLLRYARKFLFDGDDMKDIVQEAFVKAYVNIQSFDAQRRFSPWIYRIAHNEFVNAIKRKGKLPMISFDPDILLPHPIAPETADSEANRQELRRMLDRLLGTLSPKYREPLVLYYYEDMDYKGISEVLQIPISTVGVRLQRAKAMLKREIDRV
jgi:RNA polymerase sigma-70 factor, ECF subfamily